MSHQENTEFENMRRRGASPEDVFLAAEHAQDSISAIRVVRQVYSLTLAEAKEVMVRAHGTASSLAEYQEVLLPALKKIFPNS